MGNIGLGIHNTMVWNSTSVKLYGYTKSEAMGELLEDLIIPDVMNSDLVHLHRC